MNRMNDSHQSAGSCPRGPAPVAERAATVRVLGCPVPRWARWPAVLAFSFFLIKGLLWLALLAVGWKSISGG